MSRSTGARYEDLHPRAQALLDKAARTKAKAEGTTFEQAREALLARVITTTVRSGVQH